MGSLEKKPNFPKPINGMKYFYIDSNGKIKYQTWEDSAFDNNNYRKQNCWLYRTDAELKIRRLNNVQLY